MRPICRPFMSRRNWTASSLSVVGTIPPMGEAFVTPAFQLAIERFNVWLTIWAAANKILLAQIWNPLVPAGAPLTPTGLGRLSCA